MPKRKEKTIDDIAEEKYPWLDGWFFAMPDGWKKTFGLKMCEELDQILKKGNIDKEYKVLEIKEKYARLCWYGSTLTDSIFEEYSEWERKYEELSTRTCQICGESGKIEDVGGGWLATVCPHHKEGLKNFM